MWLFPWTERICIMFRWSREKCLRKLEYSQEWVQDRRIQPSLWLSVINKATSTVYFIKSLGKRFLIIKIIFSYVRRVFRVTVFSKMLVDAARVAQMMKLDLCPPLSINGSFYCHNQRAEQNFLLGTSYMTSCKLMINIQGICAIRINC